MLETGAESEEQIFPMGWRDTPNGQRRALLPCDRNDVLLGVDRAGTAGTTDAVALMRL
jgi:hypothetical protein